MIILVSGSSGSGKTTFCQQFRERCQSRGLTVTSLSHDNYYRDLSTLDFVQRTQVNFDHPDSLETDLLVRDLIQLRDSPDATIHTPLYDFHTHTRKTETETHRGSDIYLVDGILLLHFPDLRQIADLSVFIDLDNSLALSRRITRDIKERSRTAAEVLAQYQATVFPMFQKYVLPSRQYADFIISGNKPFTTVICALVNHCYHECCLI